MMLPPSIERELQTLEWKYQSPDLLRRLQTVRRRLRAVIETELELRDTAHTTTRYVATVRDGGTDVLCMGDGKET